MINDTLFMIINVFFIKTSAYRYHIHSLLFSIDIALVPSRQQHATTAMALFQQTDGKSYIAINSNM